MMALSTWHCPAYDPGRREFKLIDRCQCDSVTPGVQCMPHQGRNGVQHESNRGSFFDRLRPVQYLGHRLHARDAAQAGSTAAGPSAEPRCRRVGRKLPPALQMAERTVPARVCWPAWRRALGQAAGRAATVQSGACHCSAAPSASTTMPSLHPSVSHHDLTALTLLLALLGRACCNLSSFKDYGPNGLQVEGRADVNNLGVGRDGQPGSHRGGYLRPSADAILVHHGLFWRGHDGRVTGWMKPAPGPAAGPQHQPLRLPLATGCAPRIGQQRPAGTALGREPLSRSPRTVW